MGGPLWALFGTSRGAYEDPFGGSGLPRGEQYMKRGRERERGRERPRVRETERERERERDTYFLREFFSASLVFRLRRRVVEG